MNHTLSKDNKGEKMKLIGLSGRIKCGKSCIADHLVSNGYIKFSIADCLKKSISQLYNIDIDHFYDQNLKIKKLDLPWDKTLAQGLANILNVSLSDIWYSTDCDRVFINIREALQFVGTELLRRYDPDFHIKHTLNSLNPNYNYVCDDVRFANEKEFIEKFGGKCILIIRPDNWDIYNHYSETSVNWKMFNHVIINNKDIKYLCSKIDNFVNYSNTFLTQTEFKEMLVTIGNTTDMAKQLNCSRDKVVWWANKYLIPINLEKKYHFDRDAFLIPDQDSAYLAGLISADGCIKNSGRSKKSYILELSSNDKELIEYLQKYLKTDKPIYERIRKINNKKQFTISCNSLFIIENLKLWNIKPRKSKYNEIPEILLRPENNHLIDYWFVGLVDGDGSVEKIGPDRIRCIASEQIIDWLCSVYAEFNPKKYSEKGIDNLFTINFHGQYARQLVKRLPLIGLDRKWSRYKSLIL